MLKGGRRLLPRSEWVSQDVYGKEWACKFAAEACKVKVNVKLKFTLEQATKAQKGSRGIALLFLEPRR
jgi:hypothetical protein